VLENAVRAGDTGVVYEILVYKLRTKEWDFNEDLKCVIACLLHTRWSSKKGILELLHTKGGIKRNLPAIFGAKVVTVWACTITSVLLFCWFVGIY